MRTPTNHDFDPPELVAERTMSVHAGGDVIYQSAFTPDTGQLVRLVEDSLNDEQTFTLSERGLLECGRVRSPVPETIDLKITDKCPMGCEYCYMDSTPRAPHADLGEVLGWLDAFDQPPYQIAIGGGEPTIHPDFVDFLEAVLARGIVPSYTTAGVNLDDEIIGATNTYCGGVAITYHPHQGIDWFKERYHRLSEELDVQVNIHLLVDCDIMENLDDVVHILREDDTIVLLAYYQDVGRADADRLPPQEVYHEELPQNVRWLSDRGVSFAFSEGLMPWVMSRPELPMHHRFMMSSEGIFNCYVDMDGTMWPSSFTTHSFKAQEDGTMQEKWSSMGSSYGRLAHGGACSDCEHAPFCITPQPEHYNLCAYAPHNP